MRALLDLLGGIAVALGRRVLAYVLVGVAGLAFFGCVWSGVWLFSLVETRLEVVNAYPYAISVQVDSDPTRVVEPGHWILFQPLPGSHALIATGPGGAPIETRTIDVGVGSVMVWNVGGAARFATIRRTVVAGVDVPDFASLQRLTPADTVFPFPAEVTDPSLDANFRLTASDIEPLHDGTVRLCTLQGGETFLGCRSCPTWETCVPTRVPGPIP